MQKTTRDYILVELAKGPKTFQQLQLILSYNYDRLNASIKRLVKAGKVTKGEDGFYSTKTSANDVGKPVKKKINRIIYVLDDSGSMNRIKTATEKASNKTLKDIKTNSVKHKQETTISFYKFGSQINRVSYNKDISYMDDIGFYQPLQGSTRLLDTVGQAINEHKGEVVPENVDISYLVVVVTDGLDNASYLYGKHNFNSLIDLVQKTDRWTITFMLPSGNKQEFCRDFNIPVGNVTEWELTDVGAEKASFVRGAAMDAYFTSRSEGQTSTKGFYNVNANNIGTNELNKLEDIGYKCKVWTVESENQIKPFIESKLGVYTPGTAYYQLTKAETLQHYKKILVQKRFTKQIYAGDSARTALGLPIGVDCKIRPGNLGDFDVFMQSTSNNRILPRGVKVVHFNG